MTKIKYSLNPMEKFWFAGFVKIIKFFEKVFATKKMKSNFKMQKYREKIDFHSCKICGVDKHFSKA